MNAEPPSLDQTLGRSFPKEQPRLASRVNLACRIVLVTDQNVYLFQGPRYDRPGARLAAYPLGREVMSFDGKKLRFPDDQVVHMARFQAEVLANAAGVDGYAGTAGQVLKHAGISGERAVTVASGVDPATDKKTLGTVFGDVVAGDGGGSTTAEGRVLLVTDQKVRVFKGEPTG
jgi:hypothetical protein